MALSDDEILDLVKGVLKDLGRLKFQQIAQNLQRFEVLGRILRKDKVQFDGGNGIQRTLMVKDSGAAHHTGLFAEDDVNVADVLEQVEIPWRHTTTNWAFDAHEVSMASGDNKIVDMIKLRRTDAMLSLAKLMETTFWSKPADSTDKETPYGVFYWVVPNTSEGFNGGDPSGFTNGAGGLSHSNWKNYTAQYANITKADLIRKMRRARRRTDFESPVSVPDFRYGRGDQYRIYTSETVLEALEELGEAQNENLGRDLASMDGQITFKRNAIRWVPQLDSDPGGVTNQIMGLDFSTFRPVFLKGWYLQESGPFRSAKQHNVKEAHVDLTWNILCTDRRAQWHIQGGG